jgi:signal transduction histidine kinase
MPPDADTAPEITGGQVLLEELAGFFSRAGHDLLGPLNQSAALLALFIKRHRNESESEANVLLEHLGNAASRMDTVVAGVQRYLNMASRPLEIRENDPGVALCAALAALDTAVKASGATITADPLPAIDCDGDRIGAAFEILIDNAIKFRRPAEPPRIHVSADHQRDEILIAVADNGIGIDPKNLDDATLPFRRLNGREYPGAGLGLATVKLIARLHGGGLRIVSEPGTGTTVTIALPARQN